MDEYHKFVLAQSERNPGIKDLLAFLDNKVGEHSTCRLAALEFFSDHAVPLDRAIDLRHLAAYLQPVWNPESQGLLGRMLIVEDLTNSVVETLGSILQLDPLFFASHLGSLRPEISAPTPDLATLPSYARPDKYVNIHYYRTIVFKSPDLSTRQLVRISNVNRKVVVLPKTKNTHLGFAQHSCSVFKTMLRDKTWICIVLVDPPISGEYYSLKENQEGIYRVSLPSSLFLGGYKDFLDPPPINLGPSSLPKPNQHCLLDDLIYYWKQQRPESFNVRLPSLLHLAYYPIRIVAAEWINYLAVVHHSITQNEYTDEDLSSLRSWCRRSISSEQKMQSVARFIRLSSSAGVSDPDIQNGSWQELLAQDYDYLARMVDNYGQRFERMMPFVASMVQIADSRRSFVEAKNISRLTYLALVFIPLTFTTGLFSMNNEIMPGSPSFWIFFAVSIPITILVFAVARPPPKLLGTVQEYWRALRRPRRKVFDYELHRFGITERPTRASELPTMERMEVGFSRMDRRRGRGREETFSTL